MRTVFVNPGSSIQKYKKRRGRKRKPGRPKGSTNRPVRRRKRRSVKHVYRKVPYRIVRRRNAGIAPFIQANPAIAPFSNPRRRRRRHSNPLTSALKSPKNILTKVLTFGGGSAVGAGVNILGLRKVQNDYLRNGLRVGGAFLAGVLLPGDFGSAVAGSIMYPMWAEMALMSKLVSGPTEADLSADLSADLNGLLDEANLFN